MCSWAVVGLGNPGKHYSLTRHNVGFAFIKRIAREKNIKPKKKKYLSKTGIFERNEEKVLLAMPQTYMNNSGQAVKQILDNTSVPLQHLIVVFDDLDLPLGEIRVRKEGGAGTHKGMASIIKEIETSDFPRIRVGIGPMPDRMEAADFVLSPFRKNQELLVAESLYKARGALDLVLDGRIDEAMNSFNQRVKIEC